MYIPQLPLKQLKKMVAPGKVVVIHGPRRVGKTTLLKKYLEEKQDHLFVTGEDIFVQQFLSSQSIEKLKNFVGTHSLLVVDEAQYVANMGLNLKLIVDHMPEVSIIATSSSTFDLASKTGESLTGRKHVIKMYPISQLELTSLENRSQTEAHLENRLIYGSYPEVVLLPIDTERQAYLHELASSYLLKDILAFEGVQKSKKLLDLLVLLAFQIGQEVSHQELATQLSLNKATVEKYLDLLEQVFVLVNIRGFSRNLRKEVTKTSRYYFCDNGIRNMLVNNFNRLNRRDDVGKLWENYVVMERIKKQNYLQMWSRNFFWRTYDQKELDWVEEREGELHGYEFKWGKSEKVPAAWKQAYPDASFECITQENYLPFIC